MTRTREKLALDSARRMLHRGAYGRVANLLAPLHPAEVADFLARIPLDDRRRLALHVQPAQFQKVIAEMQSEALAEMLSDLEDREIMRLLGGLPRAQVAGVLRSFPEERREAVLQAMDESASGAFGELLSHAEGTVGAIMHPDPFALHEDLTVGEAVEALRQVGGSAPLYAYVVDDRRHLVGVLSFRQLLIAGAGRPLREIMVPDPIATRPEEPQEEAASLVSRYDFVALPVVDEDNRLLGVVGVDDVVDMLQERATEEVYKMAGLGSGDRVFAPVLRSARMRLPWLSVNLLTAFLAAGVVRIGFYFYEGTAAQMAVLSSLMGIVAGQGGNAGTQSLTLVVRGLALGELTLREAVKAIRKESATNLLIGFVIGALTALIAYPTTPDLVLCLVLGLAMVVNMFVAGFTGAAVPLVLRSLRMDPALASGVIVTTFTDCCGFGVFLGLATLLTHHVA